MHAWKLSGGVLAWGWLRAKGPDDSGEELDRVLNQLSNHTEERPGSGVAKTVALMAFFLHATVSQGWREGSLIPHGTD